MLLYYARKSDDASRKCGISVPVRNTKAYKIRKILRTIFSTVYVILQAYFPILPNLGCSSQLCKKNFPNSKVYLKGNSSIQNTRKTMLMVIRIIICK